MPKRKPTAFPPTVKRGSGAFFPLLCKEGRGEVEAFVLPPSSFSVIPDIFNRESRVFAFAVFCHSERSEESRS